MLTSPYKSGRCFIGGRQEPVQSPGLRDRELARDLSAFLSTTPNNRKGFEPVYKEGAVTMTSITEQFVGVDVCVDSLDVFIHPEGLLFQVNNDKKGIAALIKRLRNYQIKHLVMEGTGGLQRMAGVALQASGIVTSIVNPERVWAYRKLLNEKAKTDAIDAKLLALFAEQMRPIQNVILTEDDLALKELSARRDQLKRVIEAEKKRLARVSSSPVRSSIKQHIAYLEKACKEIASKMRDGIAKDDGKTERYQVLESIPGIGEVTASALVIDMPELGLLTGKQIAALAGLAPYARESGKYKGNAGIRGGRADIRSKLYMAALTAKTHNPVIKKFYNRLIQNGKSFKQAITACMRKLIVIANQMVAKKTVWNPELYA